jgi:hypothetical protein
MGLLKHFARSYLQFNLEDEAEIEKAKQESPVIK